MPKRLSLSRLISNEAGGSLAPVLIALAVGVLLLSPFLAHVSTRMLAARGAEGSLDAQYAGDSGIEYAIWRLSHDATYAANVNLAYPGPYPAPAERIMVNQVTTGVQSTVITPPGWSRAADAPAGVGQGGALAGTSNGLVYGLQGSGGTFWRYSTGTDSWLARANAPGDPKKRDGMTVATTSSVYVLPQAKDEFWRYNVSSDSWSSPPTVAEPPKNGDKGGVLAYDNHRYIFGLFDANKDNFFTYDTWNNIWEQRADFADKLGDGMSLAFAAGYVYAFQGGNGDGFYRYNPTSDSWTTRAAAPGAVSRGGSLVYTGGNYLYAFAGGGTEFWRYSLSGGTWTTPSPSPTFSVGSGGSLAYAGGDYLYAFEGGGSPNFWMYLVSSPIYDITSTAGGMTTRVRVRIGGPGNATVIWWVIQ